MVGFLARGLVEMGLEGRIAGGQRLRAVQRLGADLADMVNPHQRPGLALFAGAERGTVARDGRTGAQRPGRGEKRAQRAVGGTQQGIDRSCHLPSLALALRAGLGPVARRTALQIEM